MDFLRVGNHLALDFVNTLLAGPEGPIDLLASDADLWRWARGSELSERARPAQKPGPRLDPEVPRLRAALCALCSTRIDGTAPPRAALECLNQALALPRLPTRMVFAGGRLQRVREPLTTREDLLRTLAESTAELLESAAADRLRRCDGEGCVLLFLDVSKAGRRRWCSMSGCGNRSKVRAHYQRHREAP